MKNVQYKQDIEEAMIAFLVYNPRIYELIALKPEHFYTRNASLAFEIIQEFHKNKELVDLKTFSSRFYDKGGKVTELTSLFDADIFSLSYLAMEDKAKAYIRFLAEECAKRKISLSYDDLREVPVEFIEEVKKVELEFIRESKPETLLEHFEKYKTEYKKRKERRETLGSVGLITGFTCIDNNCAFEAGDLIVLGAKTSVGKTAFAINIALSSAMYGQKVLFFSAEMTARSLQDRIYSQLSQHYSSVEFKNSRADNGMRLIESDIEKCGKNLFLIEASDYSSSDICRIAKQSALEKPINLVVIDYLQYIKDPQEKGKSNNDRIGEMTKAFHRLAGSIECPVLLLSQVNRATSGAPELHNLRDSGNIEQDSEIVLFLHREKTTDDKAILILAKNRNGERGPVFPLKYNAKLTKFYE